MSTIEVEKRQEIVNDVAGEPVYTINVLSPRNVMGNWHDFLRASMSGLYKEELALIVDKLQQILAKP